MENKVHWLDAPSTRLNAGQISLLQSLIRVYQFDTAVLDALRQLTSTPASYGGAVAEIEASLARGDASAPPWHGDYGLSQPDWEGLYGAIAASQPLRAVFADARPPLSQAAVDDVATLAGLADLAPEPTRMLYTQDAVFMRILPGQGIMLPDLRALMTGDLTKFGTLLVAHRPVAEALGSLADLSRLWRAVLPVLPSLLPGRPLPATATPRAPDEAHALEAWRDLLADPQVRSDLLAAPAPLTLSRRLIRVAWIERDEVLKAVQAAGDTLPTLAALLDTLHDKHGRDLEEVAVGLAQRIAAARHAIEQRAFAKLDAFVYGWPKVATRAMMARFGDLVDAERALLSPTPDPPLLAPEARQLYDLCAGDRQLVRFLSLRPRFEELSKEELIRYRPAPPIVIEAPEARLAATVGPAPTPATGPAPAPAPEAKAGPEQPQTQTQIQAATLPFDYRQLLLKLARDVPPIVLLDGQVLLTVPQPTDPPETLLARVTGGQATISGQRSAEQGPGDEARRIRAAIAELVAQWNWLDPATMARAGMLLLGGLLGTDALTRLNSALASTRQLRVTIESPDEALQALPWELWPMPNNVEPLATSPGCSLVRSLPDLPQGKLDPLVLPLPVMIAVGPRGPADSAARGDREAIEIDLQKMLPSGLADVQIVPVTSEDWPGPVRELKIRRSTPSLLAVDGFPADTYARWDWSKLVKHHLTIVIFGNDCGSDSPSASLQRAAADALRAGLPAAILPLRPVRPASAEALWSVFYAEFLTGQPLEAALARARSRARSRGVDWSAFVLYANVDALEALRLPQVSQSYRPAA